MEPRPPSDLCTERAASGMSIGTLPLGCLRCGHTMLLHPGAHNPALERCLVCELATTTAHDRAVAPADPDDDDGMVLSEPERCCPRCDRPLPCPEHSPQRRRWWR